VVGTARTTGRERGQATSDELHIAQTKLEGECGGLGYAASAVSSAS
jgi:hypothetical protein